MCPGGGVVEAGRGPGGKPALLASMMDAQGVLHAADAYPEKVARGRDELARPGLRRPTPPSRTTGAELQDAPGSVTLLSS